MARSREQVQESRLDADARNNPNAEPVSYQDQSGRSLDWQGDDLAPWVQLVAPDVHILTELAASSIVAKTEPGRIYNAWAYNPSGAVAFLQVRDGTATGVPTFTVLAIPTGQSGSIDFGLFGVPHAAGIVVQLSSTAATFTPVAGQLSVRFE